MTIATSSLSASCLVVGPRRAGRDYDVLASSDGLKPAVQDLSRIRRHNFEVRSFVRPDQPVFAFFPLPSTGADVWLLAVTSLNGEAAGNPVWITTGLVLTPEILDAVDGRVLDLASPWPGAEPPPAGSTLAQIAIPLRAGEAAPVDPRVAAWAEQLGRTRLAIDAPAEAVPTVLAAVLDAAPIWRRRNLSFLTAPPEAAGGEAPALAVYESSGVPAAPQGYELIVLREVEPSPEAAVAPHAEPAPSSAPSIEASAPPPEPEPNGWDALLEAAARDRFALSRGLDGAARDAPGARAASAEALILGFVDAYLDTVPVDGQRREALFHLVRSARAIQADASRAEVIRALFKTFEKRMKAVAEPAVWLKDYLDRIEPVIGPDGPRLLPARLAIETGVIFSLDPAYAERLAPDVVQSLAVAANDELARADRVSPDTLEILLAAATERLHVAQGGAAAAGLGASLVEALVNVGGAAAAGPAIEAFVDRLISTQRWRALARLTRSTALGPLKRTPSGGRISAVVSRAVRAAPRRDLEDPRRLASALAVWRLGAAWEAA